MRRRTLLILATVVLGVLLVSGVALARDITGTDGPDTLIGTAYPDRIYGLGGADYIAGRGSGDQLYGGGGNDEVRGGGGNDRIAGGLGSDDLFGGAGNDTISAEDGRVDYINCGLGTDTAYVDEELDTVVNCENVY